MSSVRKKLCLDGGVDDIICRLPSHVLEKIFERLPVKDAARTSILSKKWRYIWAEHPYLVFDQHFFDEIIANKPNSFDKYVNLIHRVLLVHDGPVLKFNLYIPHFDYEWDEHLDGWLLFLSRNGIQKLSLNYQCPTPYKLPSYVFSSPKLTSLELFNVIFNQPVHFSGFANLVELFLRKITFNACPSNGVSHVAPVLKLLFLTSCTDIKYFNISAPQAIVVSADCSTEVTPLFFDKFSELAGISIVIGELLKFTYHREGGLMNLCELHKKFPRVRVLRLDGCYLKLSTPRRFSFEFSRLSKLCLPHLSFDDSDQILCALWLLKSSPNLVNFQASASPSTGTTGESVVTQLESPDCMGIVLNLRTVKLYFVEGSKPQLLFIKFILAHSPSLESLRVKYSVVDKEELMRFPRASTKAQVIYTP